VNTSYTYDSLSRLLSVLHQAGSATLDGVAYAYDAAGNRTSRTAVASNVTTSYSYDPVYQLLTFKYDPFGRRIEKTTSSTTSIYAYDGDNLIEETNSSGAVVARYAQIENVDEPLTMLRLGATSYCNADGLGSVTSLSSSTGTLAQTYAYDSVGNTTGSSGSLTNFFRYTGREFDTESSLCFVRARYFDPSTGRW